MIDKTPSPEGAFNDTQSFNSMLLWQHFVRNGFRIATLTRKTLEGAWKILAESSESDFLEYPCMETVRYYLYVKLGAPPVKVRKKHVEPAP
jgi:hypothetical protein